MKFKGKEFCDKPSLEVLTKCIWEMKLDISSRKMFDYYEERNWMSRKGYSIINLDSLIAGVNNNCPNLIRNEGDLREEYAILLKCEEWKRFVKKVHEQYKNQCQKCHKKERLEVHHPKYYHKHNYRDIPAKLPWEYDINEVMLLCHECHEKEHKVCGYSEHSKLSGYDGCQR